MCMALAFIIILPLLASGNTPLIGDDGTGLMYWATWWPAHAITHNYDLVHNSYILFPSSTNLLPVLSLTSSALYTVLRPVFGAVWAYNLLLPLYMILNAISAFIYFRRHTEHELYAAFASGIFALNPIMYELARTGSIALLGFFVVILALFLWDAFIEKPGPVRALLFVVSVYGVVLASMQFWPFVLTMLLPYVLFDLRRLKNRQIYVDALLPAALVFIVLVLIYPVGPVLWSTVMPRFQSLSIAQNAGQLQLLTWISLLVFARVLIWAIRRLPDFRGHIVWQVIIGLNLIAYLIPSWSPFVLLGLVSPEHVGRPIVLWLSILFAGLILIVKGLDKMAHMFEWKWLGALFIAWVVLSGWCQPLPATQLGHADFSASIAADPEDYLVADFPMGADSLEGRLRPESQSGTFGFDAVAGHILMRAAAREKPVIGGLSNTLQMDEVAPFADTPLLRLLGSESLTEGDRETGQSIRDDAARWRVGYVVVHRDLLTPDFIDSIHRWLTWTNAFCLVTTEDSQEFWRASWHPAGCPPFTLRLGAPDAAMALGSGWYAAEQWGDQPVRWAGEQADSLVNVWLTPHMNYELHIRVSSPQQQTQQLKVQVNGEAVGEATLGSDWAEYVFSIPHTLIAPDGFTSIMLQHEALTDIQGRTLTAAYDYLMFKEIEP